MFFDFFIVKLVVECFDIVMVVKQFLRLWTGYVNNCNIEIYQKQKWLLVIVIDFEVRSLNY